MHRIVFRRLNVRDDSSRRDIATDTDKKQIMSMMLSKG
jgi:hypothetical protein